MASPALIFLILMISSLSRALYGVILDVRLVNGNKPNEGTILYTEDNKTWNTSCGQHLNERNEADVICRHLGYPATNRAIQNSPFGDCDPPTTQIKCNGDEKNVSECSVTKCSSGTSTPGGVTCYEHNYLGCFYDDMMKRVLDGEDYNQTFIGLTIAKCLEFCGRNDDNVLAGVELSMECYCSSGKATNLSRQASDDDCNHVCNGSATENCGGQGKIAIFNLTADPTPSTQPIETPCDIFPDMTSSTMPSTTVQSSTHDTPDVDLSTEMGTSDEGITASSEGMTFISSSPPGGNKAPYGAIGGGVAVAVCVVMVIIVIITLRRKSKEKEDQKYGICEKTSNTSASHGYENSIVGFHEATDGDKTVNSSIYEQYSNMIIKGE